MMVRRVSICLGSLAIAVTAMAQASLMTGDSIAVFYPNGYDASQHQPSPIFENEPTALLPLSTGWTLRTTKGMPTKTSAIVMPTAENADGMPAA